MEYHNTINEDIFSHRSTQNNNSKNGGLVQQLPADPQNASGRTELVDKRRSAMPMKLQHKVLVARRETVPWVGGMKLVQVFARQHKSKEL